MKFHIHLSRLRVSGSDRFQYQCIYNMWGSVCWKYEWARVQVDSNTKPKFLHGIKIKWKKVDYLILDNTLKGFFQLNLTNEGITLSISRSVLSLNFEERWRIENDLRKGLTVKFVLLVVFSFLPLEVCLRLCVSRMTSGWSFLGLRRQ